MSAATFLNKRKSVKIGRGRASVIAPDTRTYATAKFAGRRPGCVRKIRSAGISQKTCLKISL